jgi:hypothetical protein
MSNIGRRKYPNQHFIGHFLLTLPFLHDHGKEVSSYNKLKLQKKLKCNKYHVFLFHLLSFVYPDYNGVFERQKVFSGNLDKRSVNILLLLSLLFSEIEKEPKFILYF